LHWTLHAHEVWSFIAVAAGIAVGLYALVRLVLIGARGRSNPDLTFLTARKILIPLLPGSGVDPDEALSLIDRSLPSTEGVITISYLIEVPRALALDAHLESEITEAEQVLAAMRSRALSHGLTVDGEIRRCRSASEELRRRIADLGVDLLVLALPHGEIPDAFRQLVITAPCRTLCGRSGPGPREKRSPTPEVSGST
jgi:hypothetical protein